MITVVFHFEQSYRSAYSGTSGAFDIYRESLKPFGVGGLAVIDTEDLRPPVGDAQMENIIFPSLDAALTHYAAFNKVFIEVPEKAPAGFTAVPFTTYQHPAEDVLYIVGSDASGLNLTDLNAKGLLAGDIVYIDTPVASPICAVAVATVILCHRYHSGA